jgi:ribosomal protein L28
MLCYLICLTLPSAYLPLFVGLFHGKDVRSGCSVSHSKAHTLRKWYPNVLNKRVFSYAMNDWVRFKMTARALRNIDQEGGIDNYILNLDERSVADSNYITKMRNLISSTLFHRGELSEKHMRRLKYDRVPPPSVEELNHMYENFKKEQQVPKQQPGWKDKVTALRQPLVKMEQEQ